MLIEKYERLHYCRIIKAGMAKFKYGMAFTSLTNFFLCFVQNRVSECQQRVNDLIDLKLCSDGVKTALAEEDYEQAAAHLHRFLAMDESNSEQIRNYSPTLH